MLRNNNNNQSWFSIVFLVVLVICQSHQSAGALIELSSDLIINGGPGQAIAFYGTNSAAIFNVTQSFAENNASSFTLEFWFAETCSFGSCTLFSLNTDKYSTFSYIHKELAYCFGSKVRLIDGLLRPMDRSPDWTVFNGPQNTPNWHHFAFTANASSLSCSIFIDGTPFVEISLPDLSDQFDSSNSILDGSAQLVLGQSLLNLDFDNPSSFASIPIRKSYQGFIDEIRLWSIQKNQIEIRKTINRTLFPIESTSPQLVSYWPIDTEPMAITGSITSQIIDIKEHANGSLVSLVSNPDMNGYNIINASFAALAPSSAPIVSQNASQIIHINIQDPVGFPLRYMCVSSNDLIEIPCSNLTITITQTPGAGALFAYNHTSDERIPLVDTSPNTTIQEAIYDPFSFLIGPTRTDTIQWSILGKTEPSSIRIYAPQSSASIASSPYPNSTLDPSLITYTIQGNSPEIIYLFCASELGDVVYPAITSLPEHGHLFEVIETPANLNQIPHHFFTVPGSTRFISTRKLLDCDLFGEEFCTVTHKSGAILYLPESQSRSEIQTFSYKCTSPVFEPSLSQRIEIDIFPLQRYYDRYSSDAVKLGPNPSCLLFDGWLTELSANLSMGVSWSTLSLWISPRSEIIGVDSMGSPIYQKNDERTVLQLLPNSNNNDFPFEITLLRNQSSYPSYFLKIKNWNLDPTYAPIGPLQLSTYNSPVRLNDLSWYNILVTLTPSDPKTVRVYINGTPAISGNIGAISVPRVLNLGYSETGGKFSGKIDDISFWNDSLSSLEALDLLYTNLNGTEPDIITYWPLNEANFERVEDAVRRDKLRPIGNSSSHPIWTDPDTLLFDNIAASPTDAQIITLSAYPTGAIRNWQVGTFVTSLPTTGKLYQYPFSLLNKRDTEGAKLTLNTKTFTVRESMTSVPISELEPITLAYTEDSSVPLLKQWVSAVLEQSSQRESPVGTQYWNASNLIGPPAWWVNSPENQFSSSSPVYGNSPRTWCPDNSCNKNGTLDHVTVMFDTPVFLRKVEIFQNLNPGSVVSISAWHSSSSCWRQIYTSSSILLPSSHTTLIPSICAITTFKTNVLQIQVDPCSTPGWKQFEAIRITGTETLPPGAVTDLHGRVIYVPDSIAPGLDQLSYTATGCPFLVSSASPTFTIKLKLSSIETEPIAYSGFYSVNSRSATLIKLGGYSPDPSFGSLSWIITSMPDEGELFDAKLDDGEWEQSTEISTSTTEYLLQNDQGYVFYRSPSACKFNLTSFSFYVSAGGRVSDEAKINLSSICVPSFRNLPIWILVILIVTTFVCMASTIYMAIYTIRYRATKAMRELRYPLVVLACIGAVIAEASIFVVFGPSKPISCRVRMYLVNIGSTIVIGAALSLALCYWNDFKEKSLKVRKSHRITAPIIFLLVFVIAIEIAQLVLFTTLNKVSIKISPSNENSAILVAKCDYNRYPEELLLINKGFWLLFTFITSAMLVSVSKKGTRLASNILIGSCIGIFVGVVVTPILMIIKGPSLIFALNALAIFVPITIFLILVCSYKFLSIKNKRAKVLVETTDFGLQPISPDKRVGTKSTNKKGNEALNADQREDKSVVDLMDTIQAKDRTIGILRNKLLKKEYKIRKLKQQLVETGESSHMFAQSHEH